MVQGLNCNNCGAALEVSDDTRFATCNYCGCRLEIMRTGSSAHTRVLEQIQQKTQEIAENTAVIRLQNELERIDREMMIRRESVMQSDSHGRRSEPSVVGGLLAIVLGGGFGLFWIVMASGSGAPSIMPCFGVIFVLLAVGGGIRSIMKAGEWSSTRAQYERRRADIVRELEQMQK